MGEKLIAGMLAATVIAPLCAMCVLGPGFVAAAVAWLTGTLGGFSTMTSVAVAIIAGMVLYGLVRWRRARTCTQDPTINSSQSMDRGAT